MPLANLNLQSVEEFRNFSIDSLFLKDYKVKIGGEKFNIENRFKNMEKIYIVNGIPVSKDLPIGVSIVNLDITEINNYNPLLNFNNKYNGKIWDINFESQRLSDIVIINVITDSNIFIPSNIRYSIEDEGVINILEVTLTQGSSSGVLVNNRREFSIKNSTLNYSSLNESGDENSILFNYYGFVNGGSLNSVNLNNQGFTTMNIWDVDLLTDGSECSVYGVIKLEKNMKHGTICKINHLEKNTFSNQEFRFILDGSSYAMYDGDSTVVNSAKDSSTAQNSKTIMLSNSARIYNKPRLNIYTGEVKATHGASVGRLDGEDIFYLKQRGLKESIIKSLLIDAFVIDLLDKVKSNSFREYLHDKR
ncbi:SufD family Fe-S cluster assembly protein [Thiospirochaeta perfilievii]|uniref:SufD family Fe-S cluster assembly protein n=1 Tax=Thiospirochaeta perfilievii TaxID=252967 RepID=A0A5C1QBS3_9SPIO|nr:SufD family Fe-S cluster assembly protein [Thiospirochaeta perfilievii]QEN04971.1 SufD family Fe-S cluster assembly protein [Thiospirochaeta perfilievii]